MSAVLATEVVPKKRRGGYLKNPTPLQLRSRAGAIVYDAVRDGRLPKLDGSIKCSDCAEPATCYDHRNYHHPLAVDPVCKGCNNRRGPGFPINPDGDQYRNESARKLGGTVGHCWSGLNGGVSDTYPNGSQRSLLKNMPEKTVADFLDEHWITWEPDQDVWKVRQETIRRATKPGYISWTTTFQRGLYDWFGVEPL